MNMINRNAEGYLQGILFCSDWMAIEAWVDRLVKDGCNYFVAFRDVHGPALQFGRSRDSLSFRYDRSETPLASIPYTQHRDYHQREKRLKASRRRHERNVLRKPGNHLWAVNRIGDDYFHNRAQYDQPSDILNYVDETIYLDEKLRKARRQLKWVQGIRQEFGPSIRLMMVPTTEVCNLCETVIQRGVDHCCNPEHLTASEKADNYCPMCGNLIMHEEDHESYCTLNSAHSND